MLGVQCVERGYGALLDRVGDGDQAGRLAVDRNQHDTLTLVAERIGTGREIIGVDAERSEKRRIADDHPPAVDQTAHAFAGVGSEVRCGRYLEPALLRALHNGCR